MLNESSHFSNKCNVTQSQTMPRKQAQLEYGRCLCILCLLLYDVQCTGLSSPLLLVECTSTFVWKYAQSLLRNPLQLIFSHPSVPLMSSCVVFVFACRVSVANTGTGLLLLIKYAMTNLPGLPLLSGKCVDVKNCFHEHLHRSFASQLGFKLSTAAQNGKHCLCGNT